MQVPKTSIRVRWFRDWMSFWVVSAGALAVVIGMTIAAAAAAPDPNGKADAAKAGKKANAAKAAAAAKAGAKADAGALCRPTT